MKLKKRIITSSMLVFILMFSFVPLLFAETTTDTTANNTNTADTSTVNIDSPTQAMVASKDITYANALSKVYRISITGQDVANLRNTNLGYGEISLAYAYAYKFGLSVSDVVAMRNRERMGWEEISKILAQVKINEGKVTKEGLNREREKAKAAKEGKDAKSSNGNGGGNSSSNSGGSGGGHGGGNGGGKK